MSNYRSDEEQVEILKRWWKEYGLTLIAGIVLAILIASGWQYYQRHQLQTQEHASFVYQELVSAAHSNQSIDTYADELMTHYAQTPYAKLAAFWSAKVAVMNHQLNDAATHLEWVISHSDHSSALYSIAQLRLARIYIEQNQAQNALMLLNAFADKSYLGLSKMIQGDAYLQLNNIAEARYAYQAALDLLPENVPVYTQVQIKLANLPI
jgi:predicted negative regulator of RcsB-dependent stress response